MRTPRIFARCANGPTDSRCVPAYTTDTGECQLEVKLLDGRGRTVKSRFPHEIGNLDMLSPLDRAWLQSFDAVRPVAA